MKLQKISSKDQRGIASITVTVVFIMVISLIVLGFSQVSRRNSREALDRHLSSQAFYAAETGANDAAIRLAKMLENGDPLEEQTECVDNDKYTKNSGKLDEENDVSYSCLLVNPFPSTQQFTNMTGSKIVALNANESSNGLLNSLPMEWSRTAAHTESRIGTCPGTRAGATWTDFPDVAEWNSKCPYAVLRVDIVQNNETTRSSAQAAAKATMTFFVYPKQGNISSPPNIEYASQPSNAGNPYGQGASQGKVYAAACNHEVCKFNLTGLDFPNGYMRIKALYRDAAEVQVKASSGNFKGGQVAIDSTGKAQDVLRRIQVRRPLSGSGSSNVAGFSDNALQTEKSICKRFEISPTIARDLSSCPD